MSTFTIGTDPEAFLRKEGQIISAIGLLGGNKEEPKAVEGGAVQEDNVLAEFNIDPVTTAEEFVKGIRQVADQVANMTGCSLDYIASHEFDKDYLISQGNQALEFGCEPDYNCWTGEVNEPPSPFTTLRTAGGHVHVGYDTINPEEIAQLLDIYLGVPSVLLDDDVRRRTLYGKAGAFRPKPYGAEYRVLSNFWLREDSLIEWVYYNTNKALDNRDILGRVDGDEVQRIINESDTEAAASFCRTLGVEVA